jgi:S-DNA-T family DNA segregation ATPase FtsK/SpoIIIE
LPHLLVGGTTGSGKSVFLNNVITGLMAASTKKPVNIILIDPKRVEFTPYQEIPQLAHPILTEVVDAVAILEEAEKLMDQRYNRITKLSVRNITEYNEQEEEKMPFLFVIIDEFSDLVMQDESGNVKKSIIRLAQKSRAVGIHVIIATQRPSSDVIDGLIKANFPARIAFKTSSKVDSRIILDENGAEVLLGKGDMIVRTSKIPQLRLQGINISIEEIKAVVDGQKKLMNK